MTFQVFAVQLYCMIHVCVEDEQFRSWNFSRLDDKIHVELYPEKVAKIKEWVFF